MRPSNSVGSTSPNSSNSIENATETPPGPKSEVCSSELHNSQMRTSQVSTSKSRHSDIASFAPPKQANRQTQNPIEQTGNTTQQTYRFRPDSWLSTKDANFLLKKRAHWEAAQENYAAAIQLLTRLIKFEPETAEHYVNRGLMYSHARQTDRALADYDQALEINPEFDRAYSNRANLYASQHSWAEAIADYDDAIDINPLNVRARINQAITFREMGHYEEALTCLDIALFFHPESACIYAERGRTYHLRGDWNCAIADYNTALTLTELPAPPDKTNQLGNIATIQNRVKGWMNSLT